jgi:hypothetical protein
VGKKLALRGGMKSFSEVEGKARQLEGHSSVSVKAVSVPWPFRV